LDSNGKSAALKGGDVLEALKKRLERLERQTPLAVAIRWPLMLWNMRPLPQERIEKLAANERVVDDWYRDVVGGIVWSRERITTDPYDCGRRCEPGGYLIDVLEEIHQDCWHRMQHGVCRACADTPVAENHITP
jgi:hypothetical protein